MGDKIIYVVTQGEYSDYHICGVFDNIELAEKFVEAFSGGDCDYDMDIEEYCLNPHEINLSKGYKPYFVRMSRDGNTIEAYLNCYNNGYAVGRKSYGFDYHNNLYSYCFAKDKEHAIKITNERRTMLIANNEWPGRK